MSKLQLKSRHRVMAGDSTVITDVEKLMGGNRMDLLLTDPPYGVAYDAESRVSYFSPKRLNNKLGSIKNDALSDEDSQAFLSTVFSNCDMHLKPGRAVYIFHADSKGHVFRQAFLQQKWELKSCLIWKKSVLVFGRSDYHWIHEPILYGWKAGESHRWFGDRTQTTVLEYSTDHYNKKEADTDGYVHPTQKPCALLENLIANSSQQEDIVVDPFGGSGSTLIACEKRQRRCFTMELAPAYNDVIVQRWQNYTGKEAVHEGTGKTFAKIKEERA
jgi:DNA modification methylase